MDNLEKPADQCTESSRLKFLIGGAKYVTVAFSCKRTGLRGAPYDVDDDDVSGFHAEHRRREF